MQLLWQRSSSSFVEWVSMTDWWQASPYRSGVEAALRMRYHHLRHAFASMLIAAGCSVRAVQHALGHANAATTLNLYAHLWPGDEDRIRQAVDRALADPAEDPLRTAGGDE